MLKKQYDLTPAQIRELVGAEEGDKIMFYTEECWKKDKGGMPQLDDYLNDHSRDDEVCLRVLVVSGGR